MVHALGKPLSAVHLNRELLAEFLMAFSRFEYALKRTSYAKQKGEWLTVEWRRFARETAVGHELPVECKTEFATYVKANPPRRQVVEGGTLKFLSEAVPESPTLEWLLDMAYRIRNNLFHGGKWVPMDDPSRNDNLLLGALDILRGALRLNPRVEEQYFSALD